MYIMSGLKRSSGDRKEADHYGVANKISKHILDFNKTHRFKDWFGMGIVRLVWYGNCTCYL